jgi:hypothetical protein
MLDLGGAVLGLFTSIRFHVLTFLLTACYFIQVSIREFDYRSVHLSACYYEEYSSSQPTEDLVKEIRSELFNHSYRSERQLFIECDFGPFTHTICFFSFCSV